MHLLYEELQEYFAKSGIDMFGIERGMSKKPIGEFKSYSPHAFTLRFNHKSYVHKRFGDLRVREAMIKFLSEFNHTDEFLIFNYSQVNIDEMKGFILPKVFIHGLKFNSGRLACIVEEALKSEEQHSNGQTLLSTVYMVIQKNDTIKRAHSETLNLHDWSRCYLNKMAENAIILKSPVYGIEKLDSRLLGIEKLLEASDYEIPDSEQKNEELEEIYYRFNNVAFDRQLLLKIKKDYVSIKSPF